MTKVAAILLMEISFPQGSMNKSKVLFYETMIFGIANIFAVLSRRDSLNRGSFGAGGEIPFRQLPEVERGENTGYDH